MGFNLPSYQVAQEIPVRPYNYTTGAGGQAVRPSFSTVQ
jgi:hypothetical protein